MIVDYPSEIRKLIEQSITKTRRGNELSTLIKANFPEFLPSQYSCTNLRQYIGRFVSTVVETGRAGADIVYGLRPVGGELPEPPDVRPKESFDDRVWKTFVSPSGFYGLFGHPGTGELQVVARGKSAPETPWKYVSSVSPQEHLEIGREFVSDLKEPSRSLLEQCLGQTRWWFSFQTQAHTLGLADQWRKFRHTKLEEKLRARLRDLGVPQSEEIPRQILKGSEESAIGKRQIDDLALLRRLATAAIPRMSKEELRALTIPLGYVIDELDR